MNKMKAKIGAALAALYFGLVPTAEAAGRAELDVGKEAILDVTAIAPIGKTTLVSRSRMGTTYDSAKVDNLTYVAFPLGKGTSAVVRTDFLGGQFTPRVGAQYLGNFGDLSVIVSSGISAEGNMDTLARAEYRPTILEKFRGIFGLETITNHTGLDHKFSTQRARVGVNYEGLEGGFAVDLVQKEGKYAGKSLGGFLRALF